MTEQRLKIVDTSPPAEPFEDDDELRDWLGLPDTAETREILSRLAPEDRQTFAQFRAAVGDIAAGRIPRAIIACRVVRH